MGNLYMIYVTYSHVVIKLNFRKIFLIGMLVLILSVSAVSAADENVTQGLSPDDSQDLQMTEEDTVEEGINQLDLDFNVPDKILYQEQCDFSYNYCPIDSLSNLVYSSNTLSTIS